MADLVEVIEETARAASDAAQGGKTLDSSTGDKGADKGADPNAPELGDDGKPLPYDKDPKWKAARAAEKTLQSMMKANDVETPEELAELLTSGKAIAGKLDPKDLDTIIEKANTLTKFEKVWAAQEEARKREGESAEETAERLTKEKEALVRQMEQRDSIEGDQKVLKAYNDTVHSGINVAFPDLPDYQKEYISKFLGVDNPAVVVELHDKAAVNKVVRDGIKEFDRFKQRIIKDYLDGKEKVLTVPRTGGGADTGSQQPRTTLKTARQALQERWKPFG